MRTVRIMHTVRCYRCCRCQMESPALKLVCPFCDHNLVDCAACGATTRQVEPQEFRMMPRPTPVVVRTVRKRLAEDRVIKIHQEGAVKYREDWGPANITACGIIVAAGLQPHENKLLGALIADRLCGWKHGGRRSLSATKVAKQHGLETPSAQEEAVAQETGIPKSAAQ